MTSRNDRQGTKLTAEGRGLPPLPYPAKPARLQPGRSEAGA
jgi:hypothetical protein